MVYGSKDLISSRDKWDTTEFADAMAEIYQTLPDIKGVPHTTVVGIASRNAKQLYTKDDCQRFREVTAETPKFLSEMFSILITEGFPGKGEARYECTDCQGTMVFKEVDLHKRYLCPYNDCRSRVMPYSRLGREWKML